MSHFQSYHLIIVSASGSLSYKLTISFRSVASRQYNTNIFLWQKIETGQGNRQVTCRSRSDVVILAVILIVAVYRRSVCFATTYFVTSATSAKSVICSVTNFSSGTMSRDVRWPLCLSHSPSRWLQSHFRKASVLLWFNSPKRINCHTCSCTGMSAPHVTQNEVSASVQCLASAAWQLLTAFVKVCGVGFPLCLSFHSCESLKCFQQWVTHCCSTAKYILLESG